MLSCLLFPIIRIISDLLLQLKGREPLGIKIILNNKGTKNYLVDKSSNYPTRFQ
jgi:hypothetical protein